ncbi:hypothetical protein D3C81_814460 [compost metagenome]
MLAAGKRDDIVHGQEVAFVAQFLDQCQLLGQHFSDLVTRPLRPAPGQSLLAQFAQPAGGGLACWHQFARVLVVQFAEIEVATPGDDQALGQQIGGIQFAELPQRAQMAFAIGEQVTPRLGHPAVLANGGHAILQGATPAHMHVHVATGHGTDTQPVGQATQQGQAVVVIAAPVQVHAEPQALGKQFTQPLSRRRIAGIIGDPQRQKPLMLLFQVVAQQLVGALFRPPPGSGDQPAQALVTDQVLHQQHQLRAILHADFAADDQPQLVFLGRLPGADNAGQGALVGDRQGLVALLAGPAEQLVGTGRAALEAEVGQAMQLGIALGTHANHPCNHNGPAWARSR